MKCDAIKTAIMTPAVYLKTNKSPLVEGFIVWLVHLAGIEPVRVASLDPKSSASASSAIGA